MAFPNARTVRASMDDWIDKTQFAVEMVTKAATQEMANEIVRPVGDGGRMRVDTGFLRHSLTASTNAMPQIDPKAGPDEGKTYPAPDVSAIILGWDMKATPIWLGFSAAYAAHREYGGKDGTGADGFVRMNVKRWPSIVDAAARSMGIR